MARRRGKAADNKAQMIAQGYIECRSCGELSKPGSMRCQGCHRLLPKGKRILVVILVVIIITSAMGVVFLLFQEEKASPLTSVQQYSPSDISAPIGSSITAVFTRDMNRTSVERSFSISPHVFGTFEWSGNTMTYKPGTPLANSTTYYVSIGGDTRDAQERPLDSSVFQWSFITEGASGGRRTVGTGANSFWIDRPSAESSMLTVEHPQWVIDALDGGVVMILDHSETCIPCVQQTAICNNIMSSGPEKLVFFDLLSGKTEPRASEVFKTYDPDGGLNYIPLTVIITEVPDQNGGTSIAWHSWEGVVPDTILRSWINDARAYYIEANAGPLQ